MTMRRCLRRVNASFLVSSTFWVDFFTSPCGFLENILPLPPTQPAPAHSRPSPGRRKWREWAGKSLAQVAHSLPSLAGPSRDDSFPVEARAVTSTRLALRLRGTFGSGSNMADSLSGTCTERGRPGLAACRRRRRLPPAAAAHRHRPGPCPGPRATEVELSAAAPQLLSP